MITTIHITTPMVVLSRVYSVKPDLNELYKAAGSLPHVLRDANGDLYMCTARKEDIDSGNRTTSAAKALGWAAKWIFAVEGWLAGEMVTRYLNIPIDNIWKGIERKEVQ